MKQNKGGIYKMVNKIKEETQQMIIHIPKKLHRKLKMYAVNHYTSMKEVVVKLINDL